MCYLAQLVWKALQNLQNCNWRRVKAYNRKTQLGTDNPSSSDLPESFPQWQLHGESAIHLQAIKDMVNQVSTDRIENCSSTRIPYPPYPLQPPQWQQK